jgi:CBS domain-containing protein
MSLWPLWLAAALLVPPLGRILSAASGGRRGSRILELLWTLGSVYLWANLAWAAGERGEGRTDGGAVAFLILAGLLYLELVALWGWPRPGRASPPERSETAGAGPRALPNPPEAEALLGRILELERIPCEAIMTPRDRIVWVDEAAPAGAALSRLREAGRSRAPVVSGGSLDRVVGIAHAKDLLPQVLESGAESPVRRHLRRVLRVPRTASAAQLLEDFRRNRVHLAIVGDALGGTLGLVTLGDVFLVLAGRKDEARSDGREEPSS